MAFCMIIDTPYMADATYSRIATTQVYYPEALVDVTMLCYLDENACKSGATALMSWQHRLTFDEIGSKEPTRKEIYAACHKLPYWANAKDC